MLLGIPYHVALSYRPGQQWIVRSDEGFAAFVWVAELIHVFRMPAFFLIAGYFSALLLARRPPGKWFKGRAIRLGIPFVTSILTLVPLMNLACEFSNLAYPDAISTFFWNSSHSGGYWVRHLWFIIVLLYLSAAVALLHTFVPSLQEATLSPRVDGAIARHFLAATVIVALVVGLWEAGAVELFYIAGLATNVPQQIFRLDELITYTPYYLIGLVLQRAPMTLERMCQFSAPIAVLAAVLMGFWLFHPFSMHPATGRFVATLAAIASTQTIVAIARAAFDRPIGWVRDFTEASFVIYLLHLPIICALVWLAQDIAMPVWLKGVAIMLVTLGVSYAGWLVVSRNRLLSLLFDGRTKANSRNRDAVSLV